MSTKKPIVSVVISEEQLAEVQNYQHENKIKNQSQAMLSLIRKGLEEYSEIESQEITPQEERDNRFLELFHQLNIEAQEMLIDDADTKVRSGKYIKNLSSGMGQSA